MIIVLALSNCLQSLTSLSTIIQLGVALLGANSDMNEASSLTFENDIVDIYSNSWGSSDSGAIVQGPGELTRLALQSGADNVKISLEMVIIICLFRDVMGKDPYMYGLMVTVEKAMILWLMAILKVYTPSLLELLVWMVIPVGLMRNALQRWLLHS